MSQTADVIDSLKRNIESHNAPDSFRAKSIYQYLRATLYNSSGNEPYIKEMLAISRNIGFSYGIRKGLSMYVKYYGDRGDFQRSFAYADSLIGFLKNDTSYAAKREMGILYWDLANNYNRIGDYYKSIEYYLLAIDVFEKVKDNNFLSSLYGNLSSIYTHTADTGKSMVYIQKALNLAEASSDDDLKCRTLMNYANELLNKGQFAKAEEVVNRAEPLVLKLENAAYSQYYFYMKGELARRQKSFQLAITYLQKSLRLARVDNDAHQVTEVMSLLFDCYNALNRLSESKTLLDSTLLLAEKAGLKMRRKEVYDGYAVWFEKKGDFSTSNSYLKKSIALKDSILSDENNERIAALEMQYQVAGKENEIANLKTEGELQRLSIRQKGAINNSLTGAAFIILILALLSYRNYKQKQKLQQQRIAELETEKQLTATEAVLKGEEQERSRLAKDLHDGLGGMLSGIKFSFNTMKENMVMTPDNRLAFERSMDMLDSSIKEMRRVAHNMMPESLMMFGLEAALKDFCNDITRSGALNVSYQSVGFDGVLLEQTTAVTVYRIVQELINNTLKHAAAGTAIVQLTKTDNRLSVTVEDDGKGFDASMVKSSTGMGWRNIRHRIDFLKGKLDVDSQPDKGTSVHIELDI
ncbi:putative two-component histidine kinase [Flavihumibacter petaseus NBRC 106054]|uniref:histidine kinase n=2 Tax=Flavihumibacter TaxID=1004301 RepID=A0A0E9N823_9BACT|nr:putative two-component histidine kinase [Flavihumibacter petaseus NBRC 106054]